MSELYERISNLCAERGIKVAGLCKATGIQQSVFSDLKMGRQSGLSAKNMVKVANFFEISTEELMGIKKEPVTESDELEKYIDMLRARPEMRLLLDTQDGATKEQVEENVRFLDALRKAKNAD